MKNTIINHCISRRIALLGVLGVFAVPSISDATSLGIDGATPVAAGDDDDDPPCEEELVSLGMDVARGEVYVIPTEGSPILSDNFLHIYFGSLAAVTMDLEFSSGEWQVSVTADGGTPQLYYTSGGAVQFTIVDSVAEYELSFTEVNSGASTMMNMAPILPDVILQPDSGCPPST